MVVDSSALVAIVLGEDDAESYVRCLLEAPGEISVSAATLVEANMVVLARAGTPGKLRLDTLLSHLGVRVIPVDEVLAETAVAAWQRFGRGRHSAALNYGDVFSYALAKTTGQPLLFKGTDFSQTDAQIVPLDSPALD